VVERDGRTPEPHDFVVVDSNTDEQRYEGEVIKKQATTYGTEYIVQVWGPAGPADKRVRAPGTTVTLHPYGRMSVLDKLSHGDNENR